MRSIHPDQLPELLKDQALPCVSLNQPTHRHHPDNAQDPIRYRNMLGDMQASLSRKYPAQQVQSMLEKFQELERDTDFWNHRTDGLAILASPEQRLHDLPLFGSRPPLVGGPSAIKRLVCWRRRNESGRLTSARFLGFLRGSR